MVDSCKIFSAINVTWENLTGTLGAGLYFVNNLYQEIHYEKEMFVDIKLIMKNCLFKNLKSWSGGAMYLENIDNLLMTKNRFINTRVPYSYEDLIT